MLTRELKLKPTKNQEKILEAWLFHLTAVYNWSIRSIEYGLDSKKYESYYSLQNKTDGHAKILGIHSQVFQQTINQAYNSWDRCLKGLAKKPHLKGIRNKLRSFTFPQVDRKRIEYKKLRLPTIGQIRFYHQEIPDGKLRQIKIIKRASGWYAVLVLDANHSFPVQETNKKVGIDTGFKHLAILSDGTKIENERNFIKAQKRLAQAQRGKNKELTARIHERIKNRRKDYNHKISRKIVEQYKEIYITNDNLRGQAKIFGKSVMDAGISQLRQFIVYKSANHNRICSLIDSKNTTKTCYICNSLTGPSGRAMLNVREWECSVCRTVHDRDINSARVILSLGLGISLVNLESPA